MYSHLKEKQKQILREVTYDDFLNINLVNMFEYNFGDNEIDNAFVEMNLIKRGKVGFVNYNGVVTPCKIDPYGAEKTPFYIPKKWSYYIPTSVGEKIGTFENGVDGVVMWNNSIKAPDTILDIYNELLSNTAYSMYCNLKWCRLAPIIKTSDSKTAGKVNSILKNIENGQTTTITNDNFVDSLLTNGDYKDIDILNLSDVKDSDKLKYLCDFYEFILKQYYTTYGQSMQTTNKRAQTNDAEIHGMDSISTIIPYDRLKARQTALEKVNNIFGTSYSVDLAEPFKIPYDEITTPNNDDTSDDKQGKTETDEKGDNTNAD